MLPSGERRANDTRRPDVYKRQDVFIGVDFRFVELPDNFDCLGVINEYTFNRIVQMLSEPVSYTHLDVYKRQ